MYYFLRWRHLGRDAVLLEIRQAGRRYLEWDVVLGVSLDGLRLRPWSVALALGRLRVRCPWSVVLT